MTSIVVVASSPASGLGGLEGTATRAFAMAAQQVPLWREEVDDDGDEEEEETGESEAPFWWTWYKTQVQSSLSDTSGP